MCRFFEEEIVKQAVIMMLLMCMLLSAMACGGSMKTEGSVQKEPSVTAESVSQEDPAIDQSILEAITTFEKNPNVGATIAALKDLRESASSEQQKKIDRAIEDLEELCYPGTHFLKLESLADHSYTLLTLGGTFERDGQAYVYTDQNGNKTVENFSVFSDSKKDPILNGLSYVVLGEFYAYAVDMSVNGAAYGASWNAYSDYLHNYFEEKKEKPNWGPASGDMLPWGKTESLIWTDDLGNQLYTDARQAFSVGEFYFFINRK